MPRTPIPIYCNWSAYDELSDPAALVELTEAIALRQLDELVRLRSQGVRFDHYLMDCFWYGRDSGYRSFRRPHFPDNGERWLARCAAAGVSPGLWIGLNSMGSSKVSHPDWAASLAANGNASLSAGPFLGHLMETLDGWYARGVRLFKFDFADLNAGTPEQVATLLPSELRAANATALRGALAAFRRRHGDCLLIAYNGFDEQHTQAGTGVAFRKSLDTRWLECFDSVYTGDPRPGDVPTADFWRSKDIYSDHMVRTYQQQGWPLERLDNAGFMIGTTATCYGRGAVAWKGMLLLSLSRGGRITTYYGNLDLITTEDARWWAQVQDAYHALTTAGEVRPLGAMPGSGQPYGWAATAGADGLWTLVNPGQQRAVLRVPGAAGARVVFADIAGDLPTSDAGADAEIDLPPETLVVLGRGRHAGDLGRDTVAARPRDLTPVAVQRVPQPAAEPLAVDNRASWRITAPPAGRLRLIVELTRGGRPVRSSPLWAGKPLVTQDLWLPITVTQGGRSLAVLRPEAKAIWSGMSWAIGIVEVAAGTDLDITAHIHEPAQVQFGLRVYREG